MEREQKFISKIIKDAEKQKEQLKNKAKQESDAIIKEEEKKEKEFFASEKKQIKQEYDKILENEKSSSFIEQTKFVLQEKQQILSDIFDLALQKFKKITAKEYQTFLQNVISQNAEMQDELIISNRKGEKERIQKLAIYKKKKLKIQKQSKDISGGVIIVSPTCEKDFSFEALIQDKFRTFSHKVAKQIF